MLIIKYFNDAYESYINGIDSNIFINNFIDKCINIINSDKISNYKLSTVPFINARELKFNNTNVGYFIANFSNILTFEEESMYNLFLSYLSLLIYNSKHYQINVNNSSTLSKNLMNSLNTNILITDENFLISYLNDSAKIFLKRINDIDKEDYINLSIFYFLPHLRTTINDKIMKNKRIKLIIDTNKIQIIINSIEYLNSIYNIFTFTIIENVQPNITNNIAFLSHELRNPLQTINLASSLLNRLYTNKIDSDDSKKKYIKMILQSSEIMKKIINDVLDLNKIISNEMNLNILNIQIRDFIMELISEISELYKNNKNIQINFSITNDVPVSLFTDSTRLKQIILNLILNSIKYSKKSQQNIIELNLKYFASFILFEISDNGIGIREEEISKLFKCYGQTNDSADRNDSNGLGLFISQKLANLLGGEIIIQSKYGEGSTFTLKHPVKLGYNFNINNIFNPIINLNKKILIVDDVENNGILLKTILQNMSLKYNCNIIIEVVTSGEAAINLCKINMYDIIFMDINMETIDGYSATKIIRDSGYSNIVIATTGDDLTQLVKNNYVYFDEILLKPFDDTQILNILSKFN
jgi:signal transduction histidine kinase/CheY-like chemotaxis protein